MSIDNFINKIFCGDWIEIAKQLPDECVHTVICSPPYWQQRNYGVKNQLGLEPTIEEHLNKLVMGFREIKRILRSDGTFWCNYGDKYTGGGNGGGNKNDTNVGSLSASTADVEGLEQGNLLGLAWRLALALQSDGWILRSDIIWAKGLSFCESYSGSVMPESVNGWRWERCRVKVKDSERDKGSTAGTGLTAQGNSRHNPDSASQWQDCPGCPKCEPNGGYVLRKGSWRATRGHEYLFQFAKQQGYFCDMDAVREEHAEPERSTGKIEKMGTGNAMVDGQNCGFGLTGEKAREYNPSGRNLRDVWVVGTFAWKRSHYATFPPKLIEPIIKVATSQKGCCPKCGSPWCRVIDSKQIKRERPNDKTDRHNQGGGVNSCGNTVAGVESTTLGWRPTCQCNAGEPVPAIVYDPFMGSGTVAAVAARLGRNYCGSELSKDYIEQQGNLRVAEAETGISMAEQEKGQMALYETTNT